MNKTVYLESVIADLLGISMALVKKAACNGSVGESERFLLAVLGKKRAVYSVAGVRKLIRWLSDEKNAPRSAKDIASKRLVLLLEGAELREVEKAACEGKSEVMKRIAPPGGFALPENMELVISGRESRNSKIILCEVDPKNRAAYSASFTQRGIDVHSDRLRVEVRSHHHFVNGMVLPVYWETSDLFKCTATRNPRFSGRW